MLETLRLPLLQPGRAPAAGPGRLLAMAMAPAALALLLAAPEQALGAEDLSVLADTCASCHGTDGHSPGSIPTLAGQPYEALKEQLHAFKADQIPGTTVMNRIAKGYSDEDLDALARYFSSLEP